MKQRLISAGILLAIVITCVFVSDITRVLFFGAAGILCSYEYSRAMEKMDVYCAAWVMYVYIAVQAALTLMHAGALRYIACFTGGVYLAMFSGIVHKKVSGNGAIYTVAGLAYPGFLFGVLMMISVGDIWLQSLAIGALSTWACDTAALLGGTKFGKHKLAPLVSPKKTVEGAVCGALSAIPTGALLHLLPFMREIPLSVCIVTSLIASSLGQIGDLAESLLKRMIGVKDFSDLIPGHGGIFDRVDSLLFSIPAAFVCLYVAGVA